MVAVRLWGKKGSFDKNESGSRLANHNLCRAPQRGTTVGRATTVVIQWTSMNAAASQATRQSVSSRVTTDYLKSFGQDYAAVETIDCSSRPGKEAERGHSNQGKRGDVLHGRHTWKIEGAGNCVTVRGAHVW